MPVCDHKFSKFSTTTVKYITSVDLPLPPTRIDGHFETVDLNFDLMHQLQTAHCCRGFLPATITGYALGPTHYIANRPVTRKSISRA